MSTRRAVPLLVVLGSATVWAAAGELHWPARLVVTLLLVPVPAALILQARLLADPVQLPRLPVYASSALAQLFLAAGTLAGALAGGLSPHVLGAGLPGGLAPQLAWAGGITAFSVAVNLVGHRLGVRESPLLRHLLPRTAPEKAAFAGLSVVAGVCEELVFRGFLLTALTVASGSLAVALLVSSVAFGVVHAYQDPGGVARATLLGLVLAAPFVFTGSLLAPVLAHTAIDVIGGFWLGPRLVGDPR